MRTTKRKIKKQGNSRKRISHGGATDNFDAFIRKFKKANSEDELNALISRQQQNRAHINKLMKIYYNQIIKINYINDPDEMDINLVNVDDFLLNMEPMDPIEVLIKLLKMPYYMDSIATGIGIFYVLNENDILPTKMLYEIIMFMHNTNNVNRELIRLIIVGNPELFSKYLTQIYMKHFPIEQQPKYIIEIFFEEYVNLVNRLPPGKIIHPLLNAYSKNIINSEFVLPLCERLPIKELLYYAMGEINVEKFKEIFMYLNPDVNMLLSDKDDAVQMTILEESLESDYNDIAMFLIEKNANVSNKAMKRILEKASIKPEILEMALAHDAKLPNNAMQYVNKYSINENNINQLRKKEIIKKWYNDLENMMIAYALSKTEDGELALSYGLH